MSAQDSVEVMVDEINASGWRVNNIFQTADERWQCNLWKPDGKSNERTTEYAVGTTMREAVAAASLDLRRKLRRDPEPVRFAEPELAMVRRRR